MKVSVEEFRKLCGKIFKNHGFSEEETEVCTEEIVEAQCRGRLSHGAAIIPEILEWKKEKAGSIEVVKETPISGYIMGNNNIGPLVAKRAMDIAIEKAKKNYIGIVGVNNKFPFILAGYNPRRAAKQGLIGINWSVAFSKVAPWGSADPIIGTNPIGIAIPSNDFPIVLDMAITEIAAAEIRRCRKLGLKIPKHVAISKEGKTTTDPQEAIEGAMLPFGGYKGSGLGIIIELLGGAFVGAKVGKIVPGNRGMVFVAMRCDIFVSKEKFLGDISKFIHEVKNSRVREGFTEVLLPGERAEQLMIKAQKEGIEIEEPIYQELMRLSQ
ncbi:Ldh family oxidoreductase [Dehalococcoidia bacterium]|nr:Ldh family oxidoreductase [Dehalococcoidia bacterium]MCL0064865.1 Ldh family oxidoreductase [Dehalococcoidia bacterium]